MRKREHQNQNRTTAENRSEPAPNPLDTPIFDRHEQTPIHRHAPPEGEFSHWLTVEQIRRMQRMRRETVLQAMNDGELLFEQRGRIRYARLSDVIAWEERRLSGTSTLSNRRIDPDLEYLAR